MRNLMLSLVACALACSEYGVKRDLDPNVPADSTTDSAGTDSTPDTTPGDSDTGTILPPDDTGGEDSDPLVATEEVYINTGSTLYGYDPASHTATEIGIFREGGVTITDMTDIAIDGNGYMYGATFTQLYSIDPRDARATLVQRLPDSGTGLTFLGDGRLVIAGDAVTLHDLSRGTRDTLVPAGRYTTSGDIVALPDGYLYWVVTGARDTLVRIDPQNGQTIEIGQLTQNSVYGIGYANGVLQGFSSTGRVIDIDPADAHTFSTANVNGVWWGATTNPVRW